MATPTHARPEKLTISLPSSNHDERLRPTRTRNVSSRSDIEQHHAVWRRHFAIPTPLHSPSQSQDHSRANSFHDIAGHFDLNEKLPRRHRHDGRDLSWRQRLRHFTWTWFTLTMATGQIANVLAAVPFRFHGLYTLGVMVMLFNIFVFVANTACITLRFTLHRATLWTSLTHPTESLFAPAFVISIGTILMNVTVYGVSPQRIWLEHVMEALFWVYCALALSSACGIYLIMWSTQTFTISRMTPVWIFPAYPLLVIAPHAAALAARIDNHDRALAILVGGFALQGIGFMVSLMVYAAFLYRLMTNKLPAESLRPGMFISVGPSGFTVAGVVNMGQEILRVISDDFMGVGRIAGTITMVAANWMGVWLWGLAIFFFLVSAGAHYSCVGSRRMNFAMTWFSFVFPNTGLTSGTFAIGLAFNNRPIQWVGCALTILLIVTWFFVFAMMIRAVLLKQILWPEKQEDRDEGGWMMQQKESRSGSSSPEQNDVERGATGGERDEESQDFDHEHETSGPELVLTRASTTIDRPT